MIVDFIPDWLRVWTAARAEKELKDFKFKGTGWYVTKTDTLLVVPVEPLKLLASVSRDADTIWLAKSHWAPEQEFRFYVYNGRNPSSSFNALINAPVRIDEE